MYGPLDKTAWYKTNSRGKLQPAKTLRPNAWGFFDTMGSVYEWCQDTYDGKYYRRSPRVDPVNTGEGANKVLRGLCWFDVRSYFRLSNRTPSRGTNRGRYTGFRAAMTPR